MKKVFIFGSIFLSLSFLVKLDAMEMPNRQGSKPAENFSVRVALVFVNQFKNILIMFPDKYTYDDENEKIKIDMMNRVPKNSFFIIEDTIKYISSEIFINKFYTKEQNPGTIQKEFILEQTKKQFLTGLSESLKEKMIAYKNIEFRQEDINETTAKLCEKKINKIKNFSEKLTSTDISTVKLKKQLADLELEKISFLYGLLNMVDENGKALIKNQITVYEDKIIDACILKAIYENSKTPYTILCAKTHHCIKILDDIQEQKYSILFSESNLCFCNNPQNCAKTHLYAFFRKVAYEHQKLINHT